MGCDQNQLDNQNQTSPRREINGTQTKPGTSVFKEDGLKNKMETMQRRIDELKEKVQFEGNFLLGEEESLESDFFNERFDEFSSDLQTSLSQITPKSDSSEKSLYYSASDYSISSQYSTTTDSTCYNFSGFVGNFLRNQNEKERFSLLQLHSEKQISMNLSKSLLEELELRCSEELKIVSKSLQQLDKLASEFCVQNDKRITGINLNRELSALE